MQISIVDTKHFADFNDELKAGIRVTEALLNQAIEPLLAAFPEELRPAVAPIIEQWPLLFLVSQLPLYRHMDGLWKTHQRLIPQNAPPWLIGTSEVMQP